MGTGLRRRKSDVVIIKPQRRLVTKSTGIKISTSENITEPECPSSFRILLPDDKHLAKGIHLYLKKDGEKIFISDGARNVLDLNSKAAKRLGKCLSVGYHYSGSVVIGKDNKKYGEFIRKTK